MAVRTCRPADISSASWLGLGRQVETVANRFFTGGHQQKMSFVELANGLDSLQWKWWFLGDEESGRILVTERGARVLGIFPGMDDVNGLWVNPSLLEQAEANEWRRAWNSGGDRTWVAPEGTFFIKRAGGEETYGVQSDLDPGNYRLVHRDASAIKFLQESNIKDHEHGQEVPISVEREVKLVPSPFHEKWQCLLNYGDVSYAGYELRVTLAVRGDYSHPIGIWNLIQIPAPGTIIVPTWFETEPTVILGDPLPVVTTLAGAGIRFEVDGQNRCKISIPALGAVGRLGFRNRLPDGSSGLLIRNFFVNPSGTHVDTPWDDPDDFGYAVQCYGDDGEIGAFGEMEYHSTAIVRTSDARGGLVAKSTDVSQTWYFKGPPEQIDAIALRLLGAGVSI